MADMGQETTPRRDYMPDELRSGQQSLTPLYALKRNLSVSSILLLGGRRPAWPAVSAVVSEMLHVSEASG